MKSIGSDHEDALGHPSWHLSEEKMMMTHAKKVFHTICIIFARHDAFFPFLMTWQAFEQLNRFKAAKHSMGELIGTKFYRCCDENFLEIHIFIIWISLNLFINLSKNQDSCPLTFQRLKNIIKVLGLMIISTLKPFLHPGFWNLFFFPVIWFCPETVIFSHFS